MAKTVEATVTTNEPTENVVDTTPVSTVKVDTASPVESDSSDSVSESEASNIDAELASKYNLTGYSADIVNRVNAIVIAGGYNSAVIRSIIDYINSLGPDRSVDASEGGAVQFKLISSIAGVYSVAEDNYRDTIYLILDIIAANRVIGGAFADNLFHRFDAFAFKDPSQQIQATAFIGYLVSISDPTTRLASIKQFSKGIEVAGAYLKTLYGSSGNYGAFNLFASMFRR